MTLACSDQLQRKTQYMERRPRSHQRRSLFQACRPKPKAKRQKSKVPQAPTRHSARTAGEAPAALDDEVNGQETSRCFRCQNPARQ